MKKEVKVERQQETYDVCNKIGVAGNTSPARVFFLPLFLQQLILPCLHPLFPQLSTMSWLLYLANV